MIKQILNKLPLKPSKSVAKTDFTATPYSTSNPSTSSKKSDAGNKKLGNQINVVGSSPVPITGYNPGEKFARDGNPKLNGHTVPVPYEALPGFRDVPNSEKQNLLIRKLSMCCVLFDFTDPTENLKEKEVKRQTLLELVDYMSSANINSRKMSCKELLKWYLQIYLEYSRPSLTRTKF